jgi:hypothetical protein
MSNRHQPLVLRDCACDIVYKTLLCLMKPHGLGGDLDAWPPILRQLG